MPYIKQGIRGLLRNSDKKEIYYSVVETGGDLQYVTALIIKDMMSRLPDNYATREMILGALAGAQAEFYRKVVAPYEELKEEENGGVY